MGTKLRRNYIWRYEIKNVEYHCSVELESESHFYDNPAAPYSEPG
jgi:hypothetical protein